ncbi:MAG: C39 family peptidase [Lachnospiraceae bacterium]|nr:C39 family peptidase [Lachnospiraceae bacterium]
MKKVLGIIFGVIFAVVIVAMGAMIRLEKITEVLNDERQTIASNEKYKTPVSVEGVEVIGQEVSCGYAVIEMFSGWCGSGITEEKLFDEYGKVVTSTGKAFCREMNKRFPDRVTTMYKYLPDTQLIDMVYDSLANGVPVPFEWAAPIQGQWTLHYSLVTGLDLAEDTVTIANPYGYYEYISLNEFLDRTSFEAFEDMPLYLQLAFAFGIFEKNTVFVAK